MVRTAKNVKEFGRRVLERLHYINPAIQKKDCYVSETSTSYVFKYMPKYPERTAGDMIVYQDRDGIIELHGNLYIVVPTVKFYANLRAFELGAELITETKFSNMISWHQVLAECKYKENFAVSPDCKTESKGFFTNMRVDRATVPDDWYVYDIRGGDSGYFCSVEEYVTVNHSGTFITKTPVKMNKNGYHSLRNGSGYTFLQ